MSQETPELELAGLRKQQSKARRDEVFGGFSSAERLAYDHRQNRIHELEVDQSEQSVERQRDPVASRHSILR
jgi:hypothetical protein